MKHLIIYSHPNPDSLNHHLKKTLAIHLENKGHEVIVRDLYRLAFNPLLSLEDLTGQRKGLVDDEVKIEQQFIEWSDCITFIHPIWWTGLPAMMKGYIDRVFSYGFAYRYDQGVQKGLLKQQAVIINTQGKSHEEYAAIKMDQALSLTSVTGIYQYCGLDIQQHLFFDQADKANAKTILDWESQMKRVYP